jgi:fibronectin-binding autotransporter adhesin
LRLVSDNTYTGLTTITSGILMIGQGNPGEAGSIVSNVLDNATLVFNKVEDLTYAGAISGSGAVTKQAAGTLKLTGASTYTGATTVSRGKLLVAGALAKTPVSVAGGASLGGTGSIAGSVSVAGGNTAAAQGILDLRDGAIGTLSLTDPIAADTVLTIGGAAGDSPSILGFDVGAAADAVGLGAGKLLVNPGGGIVNITPLSGFGPGTYDLLKFGGGQASGLSGLVLSTAGLPSGFEYHLQSTPTAEQLVVAVAPEPGGAVMIVLSGALLLRRRMIRP